MARSSSDENINWPIALFGSQVRKGNIGYLAGAASQYQDVKLTFKEGEKCVRMTQGPVGFERDVSRGCLVADWLSYGQTTSLMFTEPGTYDYQVDFKVGGNTGGTIEVK